MNPEAVTVLNQILTIGRIDENALTKGQKAFLRARRGYLNQADKDKVAKSLAESN